MLITFYNPKSHFNKGLDMKGNKREATHTAKVEGYDAEKGAMIYDKIGFKERVRPLKDLISAGWIPQRVLYSTDAEGRVPKEYRR